MKKSIATLFASALFVLMFTLVSFDARSGCSASQDCGPGVTIQCNAATGICQHVECEFIKCNGVKFHTHECPQCGPGNPIQT